MTAPGRRPTGPSLVVVGDALLDRDLDGQVTRLAPDAPVPVLDAPAERPRPGGAGLAAALAAAAGHEVTLVCALGRDEAGRRLRALLEAAGVRVCDLGLRGATPEKIRVRAGDQVLVRIDRGGESRACGPVTGEARAALAAAGGVLVSDYGRGVAAEPTVRAALAARGGTPVVWDPHPLGPAPVPGVTLATPNAAEAAAFSGAGAAAPDTTARHRAGATTALAAAEAAAFSGAGAAAPDTTARHGAGATTALAAAEAAARVLARCWEAGGVAVTLGARGALLVAGEGPPLVAPAPRAGAGDPCGAGDCFAAGAAARLAAGGDLAESVQAAVDAAAAFVGGGGAAAAAGRGFSPAAPVVGEDAVAVARRVRAAGGVVVATGGCFDLLHAGHVRALTAARALGDCLIVCVNSDASVRRLKGPDRPLVEEADRVAVLGALGSVDAVAVFEEDEPSAVLRRLRPHVWAKGGDYEGVALPEAAVLGEWGGRAVTVPYVAGRSTTRLIEEALTRAG